MKFKDIIEGEGGLILSPFTNSQIASYAATNPDVGTVINSGTENLWFNGTSFVPFGGAATPTEFAAAETDGTSDNLINRNTVNLGTVSWGNGAVTIEGSSFTHPAVGVFRAAYSGYALVNYNFPTRSTGQRAHLKVAVQQTSGGVATELFPTYSYVRSLAEHNNDACSASGLISLNNGDDIRLVYQRFGSNVGAVNIDTKATLSLIRL